MVPIKSLELIIENIVRKNKPDGPPLASQEITIAPKKQKFFKYKKGDTSG